MGLIRQSYSDFAPTFASEKLTEQHGIMVSKEVLIKAGVWNPKNKKQPRQYWQCHDVMLR